MGLTIEGHRRLDQFVTDRGCQLGIDINGFHTDERLGQDDFQKDYDENRESGGGPGR